MDLHFYLFRLFLIREFMYFNFNYATALMLKMYSVMQIHGSTKSSWCFQCKILPFVSTTRLFLLLPSISLCLFNLITFMAGRVTSWREETVTYWIRHHKDELWMHMHRYTTKYRINIEEINESTELSHAPMILRNAILHYIRLYLHIYKLEISNNKYCITIKYRVLVC